MTLVAEQPSTLSLSAYGQARATIKGSPLSPDELKKIDAYWRACNYLALGMIYLQDNPLLKSLLSRSKSRTDCSGIGDRARFGVHLHSSESTD